MLYLCVHSDTFDILLTPSNNLFVTPNTQNIGPHLLGPVCVSANHAAHSFVKTSDRSNLHRVAATPRVPFGGGLDVRLRVHTTLLRKLDVAIPDEDGVEDDVGVVEHDDGADQ